MPPSLWLLKSANVYTGKGCECDKPPVAATHVTFLQLMPTNTRLVRNYIANIAQFNQHDAIVHHPKQMTKQIG